jgi:hypothetical protein
VVNRALPQVRRFYAPERADVTLRDYQFVRPHVPDPSRAQASYQWDFAVVVTSLELVMTQDGIVELEGFVGGTPGYAAGQLDGRAVNEGWVSIGRANGTAGGGPFPEGARSVFAWPENVRAGALFRFEVLRTRHQARWGLYRAFPHVRHAPRVVGGVQVAPRLARVRAGTDTPLPGVRLHDLDMGEAEVETYQVPRRTPHEAPSEPREPGPRARARRLTCGARAHRRGACGA